MTYHESFDPEKRYDRLRFMPNVALQSRELNDLQAQQDYKISSLASSLFNEGDLISGQVRLEESLLTLDEAAILLDGQVRTVSAKLAVPEGTDRIAAALRYETATVADDEGLREPYEAGENFMEAGANRRKYSVDLVPLKPGEPGGKPVILELKAGKLIAPQRLHKLPTLAKHSPYDRVIDLDSEGLREALEGVKDGEHIFIRGGEYRLRETICLRAENIILEFSPSVRLVAEISQDFAGVVFQTTGYVRIRGLSIGHTGEPNNTQLFRTGSGELVLSEVRFLQHGPDDSPYLGSIKEDYSCTRALQRP